MEFFTGMVTDFIFFNAEVKTTALVIAISSSVCCSVVWLLMNIINHVCQLEENQLNPLTRAEAKVKNPLYARRNSLPPSRNITKVFVLDFISIFRVTSINVNVIAAVTFSD